MNFKIVILDLDPIVYRCGYSIQKYNKDTDILEVEPLKHALYNVNSMIKYCLKESGTTNYRGFLTSSDKSNYRFTLYKYYKENRVKCAIECGDPHPYDCHEKLGHKLRSEKPYWYKEIQEFLVSRWKAEVISGEEADDACSYTHCSYNNYSFDKDVYNSIVWSFDKDFNNIPGWHGNYTKKEIYYVSEIEALRNFYLQILTGDTSDGIPRIKKGWKQKETERFINNTSKESELREIVLQAIQKTISDTGCESECEEKANNIMRDRARLVWLRRKPNEMWGE